MMDTIWESRALDLPFRIGMSKEVKVENVQYENKASVENIDRRMVVDNS